MATTMQATHELESDVGVEYLSAAEGKELLDRQARKYLDMSGDAFVEQYRAGKIEDADRTDVQRVAMLIPLAEQ
jgi:hypothetical protein